MQSRINLVSALRTWWRSQPMLSSGELFYPWSAQSFLPLTSEHELVQSPDCTSYARQSRHLAAQACCECPPQGSMQYIWRCHRGTAEQELQYCQSIRSQWTCVHNDTRIVRSPRIVVTEVVRVSKVHRIARCHRSLRTFRRLSPDADRWSGIPISSPRLGTIRWATWLGSIKSDECDLHLRCCAVQLFTSVELRAKCSARGLISKTDRENGHRLFSRSVFWCLHQIILFIEKDQSFYTTNRTNFWNKMFHEMNFEAFVLSGMSTTTPSSAGTPPRISPWSTPRFLCWKYFAFPKLILCWFPFDLRTCRADWRDRPLLCLPPTCIPLIDGCRCRGSERWSCLMLGLGLPIFKLSYLFPN